MAFDSVFQGPPEDVAAPGTAQSPSLGVDVTNKELYISAGKGWEELSAGGGGGITGAGTAGFIPKFSTSSSVDDSHIDDGVTTAATLTASEPLSIQDHACVGIGSEIDNDTYDGNSPVVLVVAETVTSPHYNTGITSCLTWAPTTDIDDDTGPIALNAVLYENLDGQSKNLQAASSGINSYVENDSNVASVLSLMGAEFDAENIGNGDVQHLWGGQFAAGQQGTGEIIEELLGVIATVRASAGHVPNMYGIYVDTPVVSGTALVDKFNGLHVHQPIVSSSNPIGSVNGIQIDISIASGITNARSIDSTGTAPSVFAGPVAVPTLRAQVVYSVAGTALPSAVTEGVGARAFVSDAVANTFNTTYVGSGTNKVPVFSDGTVWRIG